MIDVDTPPQIVKAMNRLAADFPKDEFVAGTQARHAAEPAPRPAGQRGTEQAENKMTGRRLIIDEGLSRDSAVVGEFKRLHGPDWQCLYLHEEHPGIPDVEILQKLLGAGNAVLLTKDRVLHMRAVFAGYPSYTLTESGQLTGEKLKGVRLSPVSPRSVLDALQNDYRHQPVTDIALRLKGDLTDRQLKWYRTMRRRMRSHFGSAAAITRAAITVGGPAAAQRVSGFALRLEGKSGVKGLLATEHYYHGPGNDATGLASIVYALRESYLLQLEGVSTDIFIIQPQALEQCQAIAAQQATPSRDLGGALQVLLSHMGAPVRLLPCTKGRFHNAMALKLTRLATGTSNEIVAVNFIKIIDQLLSVRLLLRPTSAVE